MRWAMVCTMRQDPGAMPAVSSAKAWQKRRASASAASGFATALFRLGGRSREAVVIRQAGQPHDLGNRSPAKQRAGDRILKCSNHDNLPLDVPAQCCGVCLSTLTNRGSTPCPPLRLSLETPTRRPEFRPPRFSPRLLPATQIGTSLAEIAETPAMARPPDTATESRAGRKGRKGRKPLSTRSTGDRGRKSAKRRRKGGQDGG
jgi:hypothetical protein